MEIVLWPLVAIKRFLVNAIACLSFFRIRGKLLLVLPGTSGGIWLTVVELLLFGMALAAAAYESSELVFQTKIVVIVASWFVFGVIWKWLFKNHGSILLGFPDLFLGTGVGVLVGLIVPWVQLFHYFLPYRYL